MRRRFGYLHVPKTAGSSVTEALRAAIAAADAEVGITRRVSPYVMDRTLYGTFDRFDDTRRHYMVHTGRPAELAACDVVVGHYGLHSLTQGRTTADVVIVVRHPVARLLSHYLYWRGWSAEDHASWDPYDGNRLATRVGVEAFMADPSVAPQTDNVVARMLLAPHPLVPVDGFIAPGDVDAVRVDALAAIDSLGFADVLERGEACWAALGRWLDAPLVVGRKNVTPVAEIAEAASGSLSAGALAALEARSVIDRDLWLAAAHRADPSVTDVEWAAIGERVDEVQIRRAAVAECEPAAAPPTVQSSNGRTPRGWRRGFRRRGAH